jgi:hypothetical protein
MLGSRDMDASIFSRVDVSQCFGTSSCMEKSRAQRQFALRVLAGLATSVVVAVLYFFSPTKFSFYPQCPFHALTGLNCPGCGSLRALHALLHGNFRQAMVFNPLTICLLPALGFFAVRPIRESELRENRIWLWLLAVGVVAFTILRNLPQLS